MAVNNCVCELSGLASARSEPALTHGVVFAVSTKYSTSLLEMPELTLRVRTPEMTLELPLLDVFGRGGSLKSSWYGDCLPSRDFPMLIDLYRQGKLDLDAFVTERITIDQIEEAFDKMHSGSVLRSVVEL